MPPSYAECWAWATYWAQHWFLDSDGRDRLSRVEGLAAGWATHVESFRLLLDVALRQSGTRPRERSIPESLKDRGLDRLIRAWGLRAMAAPWTPSEFNRGAVAFIVEIPTPSMLEPARLVAEATPQGERVVACADPRALRVLRSGGLDPYALILPIGAERRFLTVDGSALKAALSEIVASPPQLLLGANDVTAPTMATLSSALRRSLPWLAAEHEATRRFLLRTEPRAVVVASDQHRIGRLATSLAAQFGIPTTVLQHGMPQSEVGFLPVIADRVAAWSADAVKWFSEQGTAHERLTISGNPRFDELFDVSRPFPDELSVLEAHPRLLLALSPTSLATNRQVVSLVLEALHELPQANLVIKLHPGHREWRWVEQLVAAAKMREQVVIAHRQKLAPLLRWSDVTMLHRSTVALESLAVGTPVLVIEADEPSVADVELSRLDLPRASGPGSIAAALRKLLDPVSRNRWFSTRAEAIKDACGPVDGHSANRIAALLSADRQRSPRPVLP